MTTLPPLAPIASLEARLGLSEGSLQGPDRARAEVALGDASALIRQEAGVEWVTDDEVTAPDAVVTIALRVALRDYRNPLGVSSESMGDYSYRLDSGAVGAYLTPEERRVVRSAAGTTSSGVTSVATPSAYGEREGETTFLDVVDGGEPIPWGDL